MKPCPPDLERVLPPPPPSYSHVVIGGNLVLLDRANFQIVDVFQFDIHWASEPTPKYVEGFQSARMPECVPAGTVAPELTPVCGDLKLNLGNWW
jgi:hypothetical protein